MPPIRQSSFLGGEISPARWGRTDDAKHAKSLRTMRNFFASHDGAAVSRPGALYLGAATQTQDYDAPVGEGDPELGTFADRSEEDLSTDRVRLIPFIYSDSQSYVLEFGYQYIQVWSYGERVGSPIRTPLTPFTAPLIPYVTADLPFLKYAQSGDVLTICCDGHPAAELRRESHTVWTYSLIDFSRPAPVATPYVEYRYENVDDPALRPLKQWKWKVTELRRATATGAITETSPLEVAHDLVRSENTWNAYIPYVINQTVIYAGNSYRYKALGAVPAGIEPTVTGGWGTYWVVAGLPPLGTPGTQANAIALEGETAVYPEQPMTVVCADSVEFAFVGADDDFVGWRVYRGRAGLFGWIGDVTGTDVGVSVFDFTDFGNEPDYARGPPQGRNPFAIVDSTGSSVATEHPRTVGFFEERRVFGGTSSSTAGYGRPATIFVSATGDYANYDQSVIPLSSDAGEWELACRRREEIRGLAILGKILALTNSSTWSFGGAGGAALSPAEANPPDAKAHLQIGSSWVDPLVVGNVVLQARTKGSGVRDLLFDINQASYTGGDLTEWAQHLFREKTIVDWCYAEDPWGIVWVVLSDGSLLSLTYDRAKSVWAWARHDMEGAAVESICSVPEDSEDVVYLVVARPTVADTDITERTIERFATRVLPLLDGEPDGTKTVALDCAAERASTPSTSGNELWSAGLNANGQRGLGDTVSHPDFELTTEGFVAVSVGFRHALGIKSDGTLWGVGHNAHGALADGVGGGADSTSWVSLSVDTDWASVAAGNDTSYAIKTGGTLWVTGRNHVGQMGVNSTTDVEVLTPVGVLDTWASVSTHAGGNFALALDTDGLLWAVGHNSVGQLGDGSTSNRDEFVQVGFDSWLSVSAGALHSLGVKYGGTLWAWGDDTNSQGAGTGEVHVPTRVGVTNRWLSVAAGDGFSFGLKNNGTLHSWGINDNGQLGQGDVVLYDSPTPVGDGNDWGSISAGNTHAVGIRITGANRALWAVGGDAVGQCADGLAVDLLVFTQVGAEVDWTVAAAGTSTTMACRTAATGAQYETTIEGLEHLEGRSVMALADGSVCGPYTVASGVIDIAAAFPEGAAYVVVGLSYTAELELLDLSGTKHKNVTSVTFEVVESRGLEVGENSDNTSPWKQRRVSDSYGPIAPATDMVKVGVSGSWNLHGRAYLKQTSPLFVTIYGITREVEVGGS